MPSGWNWFPWRPRRGRQSELVDSLSACTEWAPVDGTVHRPLLRDAAPFGATAATASQSRVSILRFRLRDGTTGVAVSIPRVFWDAWGIGEGNLTRRSGHSPVVAAASRRAPAFGRFGVRHPEGALRPSIRANRPTERTRTNGSGSARPRLRSRDAARGTEITLVSGRSGRRFDADAVGDGSILHGGHGHARERRGFCSGLIQRKLQRTDEGFDKRISRRGYGLQTPTPQPSPFRVAECWQHYPTPQAGPHGI